MDVIHRTKSSPALVTSTSLDDRLVFKLPRTGYFGACLMLFKAMVGASLFALPWATKTMGFGGMIIAMAVCGALTMYTNNLIVRVHTVVVRDTFKKNLTYVSLVQHTFGRFGGGTVYGLLLFTTLGSLTAYLLFCGKVMHSIVPAVSTIGWAGIVAVVVTPLCLTRNDALLAYTSMAGNVGVALVVATVLARAVQNGNIQPLPNYTDFKASSFMQAFGVVGFLFACSTNVLTISRAMKNRSQFPSAMAWTTIFTSVLCGAFALVMYLFYGAETCSIIVLNSGEGGLAWTAKLAIVIDLAFSYPLVLAPAREIVERSLFDDTTKHLWPKQAAVRVVMVLVTFLICFYPGFSVIMNIVGSWSVAALAFILPPIMLLQLRRFHMKAYTAQLDFMATHGLLHAKADKMRGSPEVLALPEHTHEAPASGGGHLLSTAQGSSPSPLTSGGGHAAPPSSGAGVAPMASPRGGGGFHPSSSSTSLKGASDAAVEAAATAAAARRRDSVHAMLLLHTGLASPPSGSPAAASGGLPPSGGHGGLHVAIPHATGTSSSTVTPAGTPAPAAAAAAAAGGHHHHAASPTGGRRRGSVLALLTSIMHSPRAPLAFDPWSGAVVKQEAASDTAAGGAASSSPDAATGVRHTVSDSDHHQHSHLGGYIAHHDEATRSTAAATTTTSSSSASAATNSVSATGTPAVDGADSAAGTPAAAAAVVAPAVVVPVVAAATTPAASASSAAPGGATSVISLQPYSDGGAASAPAAAAAAAASGNPPVQPSAAAVAAVTAADHHHHHPATAAAAGAGAVSPDDHHQDTVKAMLAVAEEVTHELHAQRKRLPTWFPVINPTGDDHHDDLLLGTGNGDESHHSSVDGSPSPAGSAVPTPAYAPPAVVDSTHSLNGGASAAAAAAAATSAHAHPAAAAIAAGGNRRTSATTMALLLADTNLHPTRTGIADESHLSVTVRGHHLVRPRVGTAVDVTHDGGMAADASHHHSAAAAAGVSVPTPIAELPSASPSPVATGSSSNSPDGTPGAAGEGHPRVKVPTVKAGAMVPVDAHHHAHGHHTAHRTSTLSGKLKAALRKKHGRHMEALQMLGMGTNIETAFLVIVALFGLIVLIMCTVQSIQEAISSEAETGICASS